MSGESAAIRKTQESREWIRQITTELGLKFYGKQIPIQNRKIWSHRFLKNSKSRSSFSQIFRKFILCHHWSTQSPINYCDLSDDQVTEIQLANYKALVTKQHSDGIESFCPSAPPMNEDTETSPQSHINCTSEQLVTEIVHAPYTSTASQSPPKNTASSEQEERVLFLTNIAEGDEISIDQIKSAMTTSPREGIAWGPIQVQQDRSHRYGDTRPIECLKSPSDLINHLEQIEDVYVLKT